MSMDRPIQPTRRRLRHAGVALLALAGAAAAWAYLPSGGGRTISRARAELAIAEVTRGTFEDVIPVTAEVAPRRIVYLDAREGGHVEEVLAEQGDPVTPGQLLARLSNPSLQLDVVAREAQITEQLSTLRTAELSLEQDRLTREREQVEVEHQLDVATRAAARSAPLEQAGAIPAAELEDARASEQYLRRRLAVLARARAVDARVRQRQLEQIRASSQLLEQNLATTRAHLKTLELRAPIAGTLTAFDLQVGQSVRTGERVGQVDLPGEVKLVTRIDQFYAPRVREGQRAELVLGDARHPLTVAKLYPQVEEGRLVADLHLTGTPPGGLRRGQTVQVRLFLGEATTALLVPVGAFLQDTGGRWAFVVGGDGSARRRPIRTGRQNAEVVEILDGLAPGDRVVTASYAGLAGFDRIVID